MLKCDGSARSEHEASIQEDAGEGESRQQACSAFSLSPHCGARYLVDINSFDAGSRSLDGPVTGFQREEVGVFRGRLKATQKQS